MKRKSAGSAVTTTFTKEVMTNHGMNQGKSCGILLANGEKIKNNCVVLGKTLELQGIFVSGKVLIPLGRWVNNYNTVNAFIFMFIYS